MMRSLAYNGVRVLRRAARVLEQLGGTQTVSIEKAMTAHDMVAHPDEDYYRRQYWRWLLPEMEHHFPDRKAEALDVGCGQGRLALPLAQWLRSGNVVGIDLTQSAIDKARDYSRQSALANINFYHTDALDYLRGLADESIDLALMIEVTFFMPTYREVIAEISRVLKPGGLFFVSFRSQYFDLLHSVRSGDWQSARLVCAAREGHWGGGTTWFSWQTVDDVAEVLSSVGLKIKACYGIGIASGIEGDPLSSIAQPSKLAPAEQDQLAEIEISLANQYAACGRYILAVAVKET